MRFSWIFILGFFSTLTIMPAWGAGKSPTAYEPAYDSLEYRNIQSAFVQRLSKSFDKFPKPRSRPICFNIGFLRVKDRWAFAHAHLRSRSYKRFSYYYPAALLHQHGGRWRVVALVDTRFNWDSKEGRNSKEGGDKNSPAQPPIVINNSKWASEMRQIAQKWTAQFSAPKDIFLRPNNMSYQDFGKPMWF